MSQTVELVNPSGDWREVVAVQAHADPRGLIVRWPLGGLWKLDLRTGYLLRQGRDALRTDWRVHHWPQAWHVWLALLSASERDARWTVESLTKESEGK